jgi:hypothetical protein
MPLSAVDRDLEGLLALDAGDNADDAACRLKQRPLLNMQFEVTARCKTKRFAR